MSPHLRTRTTDASVRIRIRDRIRAAGGAVSTYVVCEADALQELLDDGLVEMIDAFWCVPDAEVDVAKLREILDMVTRYPGLTATEIAARLGFEAGPTSAHLCSARKTGHVRSEPCTQSTKRPTPLRWYSVAALAASEAAGATTDPPALPDAPTSATEQETSCVAVAPCGGLTAAQIAPPAPTALDTAAVLVYLRERIAEEKRLKDEASDAELAAGVARSRHSAKAGALLLALEAIEEAEDADG